MGSTRFAYRYRIEIDNLVLGHATEISSVSIDMKTADQMVAIGDGKSYLHSYPGVANYGDITFKALMVEDVSEMFGWLQDVIDNKFTKSMRNGSLIQLPADANSSTFTGQRWNFEDAWPAKWQVAASGAGSVAVVYETLTLKVARIWPD